jgi:hypothetical protein
MNIWLKLSRCSVTLRPEGCGRSHWEGKPVSGMRRRLAHREPLAAVLIEGKRLDRGLLGRALVGSLNRPEIFGSVAQDRDAPVTELGGGGFLLGGSHGGKITVAAADCDHQLPTRPNEKTPAETGVGANDVARATG